MVFPEADVGPPNRHRKPFACWPSSSAPCWPTPPVRPACSQAPTCPYWSPTALASSVGASLSATLRGIGLPIAPARRHLGSGGLVQDFERGQIAVHPRWAGQEGLATPDFVFSAHDTGKSNHVRWSGVPSKGGDFALLHWNLGDHPEAVAKQHETVDA